VEVAVRVAIAGAGNVGQSIARSLLESERNKVLIIERQWAHYRPKLVPGADWMYADACEYSSLQAAGIDTADVVIAATGDDKVNLVFSFLAKTRFGVERVVARVNEPSNHWLFSPDWGVDVAVSTPVRLAAAVDEAVLIGQVVQLMHLHEGGSSIVEYTVPAVSGLTNRTVADLALPAEAALIGLYRDGALQTPSPDLHVSAGDGLVLLVAAGAEPRLRASLGARG
jgi:trk system potassium uptake protein TrkA